MAQAGPQSGQVTKTTPEPGRPGSGADNQQAAGGSSLWGKFGAVAQVLANVATAIALIVAVAQIGASTTQLEMQAKQEQSQRRFDVYNELNNQYVDFLKLCLEHPKVDCFDGPLPMAAIPQTAEEVRAEQTVFATLTSLLERAFVFYQRELGPEDKMTAKQWPGWESYARSFRCRARFNATWEAIRHEFDAEFVVWLQDKAACEAGAQP